jgi:tRNA (guanine26-N2/guanine27-N2)-dimethyltransferase
MHGVALKPVLSHATQHYFRIYLWAERGARKTDEIFKGLGHVLHCFECGRRSFAWGMAPELDTRVCRHKPSRAGPLWLGPLSDPGFTREVLRDLSRRGFRLGHLETSLLNLCGEEAEGRPAFYEINELAKLAKTSPPKLKLLMERLKNSGHPASRTHFSPTGFRTDMPLEKIIEYLKSI